MAFDFRLFLLTDRAAARRPASGAIRAAKALPAAVNAAPLASGAPLRNATGTVSAVARPFLHSGGQREAGSTDRFR